MEEWLERLIAVCSSYNIPHGYLAEIIKDAKVIPMIRGKAFEFVVLDKLKELLDDTIWEVSKPELNPQLNSHDIDVKVKHIATNRIISVECKLAKKGSCVVDETQTRISVKCMRSRTLGPAMVHALAPQYGIDEDVLSIHNDQYLPTDFDFVITSIGNAFYQTDEFGNFIFEPQENQLPFLENFAQDNLQQNVFNQVYIARTTSIAITTDNHITCTRRRCENNTNCGFIPNYPVIEFNTNNLVPIRNWFTLDNADRLFREFLELDNQNH